MILNEAPSDLGGNAAYFFTTTSFDFTRGLTLDASDPPVTWSVAISWYLQLKMPVDAVQIFIIFLITAAYSNIMGLYILRTEERIWLSKGKKSWHAGWTFEWISDSPTISIMMNQWIREMLVNIWTSGDGDFDTKSVNWETINNLGTLLYSTNQPCSLLFIFNACSFRFLTSVVIPVKPPKSYKDSLVLLSLTCTTISQILSLLYSLSSIFNMLHIYTTEGESLILIVQ